MGKGGKSALVVGAVVLVAGAAAGVVVTGLLDANNPVAGRPVEAASAPTTAAAAASAEALDDSGFPVEEIPVEQIASDDNAGTQTTPDAEWPLGDRGYGEYELGQRYSFLLNQITARGLPHKVEFDATYAHKSITMPQTALGTPWQLRLAFDQIAEKVVGINLSHRLEEATASAADCEQRFSQALDKMSAVAGFAPTSQQADRHRWEFRNGHRIELTRNCSIAPYRIQFELRGGEPPAGV